MLKDLNRSELEAVIKNAATQPDLSKIASNLLQENPRLLDAIVQAVGRNAEATKMLGRAIKTIK